MKEKDFIMNESGDYSEKFSECLDYGETILWTGKNEIKSTAATRLLGLAVLVFTVACFAAVYSSGSNFWIVIVPFIVVGLALTFGKNSDYYYALTDKRLIYFTFKKPSYINYEDIINIELKKEEKNTATITIYYRSRIMKSVGGKLSDELNCPVTYILQYVGNYKLAYRILTEHCDIYTESDQNVGSHYY